MRASEIYKYNPRQIPVDELRATFVARRAQLESVLGELRGRARDPVNQHFLVLGPRGIGKTNFLLMVRYAVAIDEELEAAYLPVQTAEEEYSIAGLRDLFDRVCELLVEDGHDGDLAAARETAAAIDDDDHAAEVLIAAVKALSDRQGQKILLLVDNLDLILDQQLGDDAELGRLRDLLMNESFLALVGAAPTYFKEVSGYDRPFYNFFRPVELEELTPEQMGELLRRHAELDDAQPLLERFEEFEPQLRAIHHMTGGNPRLVLVLYQLSSSRELPEVRATIEGLLDSVTPYYKARLEALPLQQRRVMDTFARLGHPATPTELARETRLPPNQVSSHLKRLEDAGFVTIAPQKRRRSTLYVVSEPTFRIWHQMRFSASRRKLGFLVEFLRIWYRFSPEEWAREAARVLETYKESAHKTASSESGSTVKDIIEIAQAAPDYDQGFSLLMDALEICVGTKDREHAEQILERMWQGAVQGEPEKLALAGVFTAFLREEEGRREEALEAIRKGFQTPTRALGTDLDLVNKIASGLFAMILVLRQRRLPFSSMSRMEQIALVATPFLHAIRCLLTDDDAEVLDRLNPEMRESVEAVLATWRGS